MPSAIDVTDSGYGATGNGITDDTVAIQLALNAIDTDGTVTIPPGIYKLRKAVSHYATLNFNNTYFSLQIMRRCKIAAYGAVFLVDTSVTDDDMYGAFWAYGVDGIEIGGGSIFGTAPSASGGQTSRPGILLQDCSDCLISDVTIRNLTQGINIYNSDNCTLQNIASFNHKYSGIMFYLSNGGTVENCHIRDCGDGHLSLFYSSNIHVIGCTVLETRWADGTGHGSEQGITLEHNTGSSIANCALDGFFYGVDCKNLTTSCQVKYNSFTNNLYSAAIRMGDEDNPQIATADITIEGNVMTDKRPGVPDGSGGMIWGAPVFITGGTGHIVNGNSADSSPNPVCETANPNVTIGTNRNNIPVSV